jgi:hypothetical protein
MHSRRCVYDRCRKIAEKQVYEELDYYRGFVDLLLNSIRYCELEHVNNIVRVIRTGGSLREISDVVNDSLNEVRRVEEGTRGM